MCFWHYFRCCNNIDLAVRRSRCQFPRIAFGWVKPQLWQVHVILRGLWPLQDACPIDYESSRLHSGGRLLGRKNITIQGQAEPCWCQAAWWWRRELAGLAWRERHSVCCHSIYLIIYNTDKYIWYLHAYIFNSYIFNSLILCPFSTYLVSSWSVASSQGTGLFCQDLNWLRRDGRFRGGLLNNWYCDDIMMYDVWAISLDLSCYYILPTVFCIYVWYIPHAKEPIHRSTFRSRGHSIKRMWRPSTCV